MNVRNPDITGPCRHLKTGARIRAQHEHIKNVTTHPALTGEGGSADAAHDALFAGYFGLMWFNRDIEKNGVVVRNVASERCAVSRKPSVKLVSLCFHLHIIA